MCGLVGPLSTQGAAPPPHHPWLGPSPARHPPARKDHAHDGLSDNLCWLLPPPYNSHTEDLHSEHAIVAIGIGAVAKVYDSKRGRSVLGWECSCGVGIGSL